LSKRAGASTVTIVNGRFATSAIRTCPRPVDRLLTDVKEKKMSTAAVVWIIVAVVVIAIIVVVAYFGRKSRLEANRTRAQEIRQKAKDDEFGAREREAKAASAEAAAKQAEVDAERLRREAAERIEDAQTVRAQSNEQVRKADEIDPDVRTTHTHASHRSDNDGRTSL
jgi:uncharacterized protein HemX